ncbi:hypothetical protein C8Q74DRAFT_696462 [Fomes fomentarius]|nr:hypothetical protein C8Q74DRAFT_696462 [Fomes fomentarius]
MSYGLDLSPAQAPLNCFGSRIMSRDTLSSRILARIRPRHYRKTDYNERLRLGDIAMSEAWEIFGGCQHSLSYEKRLMIQAQLNKLRTEREGLGKFTDYRGSQQAEVDALSRAGVFRENAIRVRAMAAQARKNSLVSLPGQQSQHAIASSTSVHRPSTRASRTSGRHSGVSSEQSHHSSTRSTQASLSRVPTRDDQPLEMIQTRAGPMTWSPSPSHNALQIDLGYRASPRPPTMMSTGTPLSSILSLEIPLARFSPLQTSAVSLSPTDSVGAYSLASDGFPRPSRRRAERRSTIQTKTSLGNSSAPASRKSTQQSGRSGTYSSYARQSLEGSARRSNTGSGQSHSYRSGSQDSHARRPYVRSPMSLRTSSVPPRPGHTSLPGSPHY